MSRRRRKKNEPPHEEAGASAAPDARERNEVARRAYELYLERGGQPGHELEDWLRAEAELRRDQE